MRTVKAFACEKYELKRFAKKNKEAYELGCQQAKYSAMLSFINGFAMYSCMAGVIYYGAVLH